MFLFISILSAALLGEAYLNTSHVLIYLDTSSDVAAEVFYLNTSHVLIYQR